MARRAMSHPKISVVWETQVMEALGGDDGALCECARVRVVWCRVGGCGCLSRVQCVRAPVHATGGVHAPRAAWIRGCPRHAPPTHTHTRTPSDPLHLCRRPHPPPPAAIRLRSNATGEESLLPVNGLFFAIGEWLDASVCSRRLRPALPPSHPSATVGAPPPTHPPNLPQATLPPPRSWRGSWRLIPRVT